MADNVYFVSIKPRKTEFDPVGRAVKSALVEEGQAPASATVHTERIFRIAGSLTDDDVKRIADVLLVDPVVETARVASSEKDVAAGSGLSLAVWPKPGVTDPVGETVEKGILDLGITVPVRAASATRYLFPKIKDAKWLRGFAARNLANELVHDIHI